MSKSNHFLANVQMLLLVLLLILLFPSESLQAASFITLHCQGNGLYVSGRWNENGQTADLPLPSELTMFVSRKNRDGTVSFISNSNRMFLTVLPNAFGRIVLAQHNQPTDGSTKFKLIPYTDGTYAIKAASIGKYLSCRNYAYQLFANREKVEGPFERFYLDIVTTLAEFVTARVPLKLRHFKAQRKHG
ncbi:hypothetical protein niasHT_018400 [Heterodera trifolii]|uniref:Uncharacterized protein n=1 Tax=Heterodera trifolii TaxID=157864 RepID=A0ABD2LDT4_9BILA